MKVDLMMENNIVLFSLIWLVIEIDIADY